MCCMKYLKCSCCLLLKFWRNVLRTSSKCHKKTSVGLRPWDVPRTLIWNLLYKCILITLFSFSSHQMGAWNTKELNLLFFCFWTNVLKTSYKGTKVMSGGWRSYKTHFCGNIFIFNSLNVCIKMLTKMLVIVYCFIFRETP